MQFRPLLYRSTTVSDNETAVQHREAVIELVALSSHFAKVDQQHILAGLIDRSIADELFRSDPGSSMLQQEWKIFLLA